MFFGGSENERRAVEQGFHYLPNLAANPEEGIDMAKEPSVDRICRDDYILLSALFDGDPDALRIATNLIDTHFSSISQIERISAETSYIFPSQTWDIDNDYIGRKYDVQKLAGNLTFRALVRANQGKHEIALDDIKRVHQISENLRKSPNLDAHWTANGAIKSIALRYLGKILVGHRENVKLVNFVDKSIHILAKNSPTRLEAIVNWQANAQLNYLNSEYFADENREANSLGPLTLPIPKQHLREKIFDQYLANIEAIRSVSGGEDQQLIALLKQSSLNSLSLKGGIFARSEFMILGYDPFEQLPSSKVQSMILESYLSVLKFEMKNKRLPDISEIEMPVNPYSGLQLQYIHVPVPGRKRPRVLIVSPDTSTPFIYTGGYLSKDKGIIEPDPTAKKSRRYFRPNGTEIRSHDPDYPNAKAPTFGSPPKTPVIVR